MHFGFVLISIKIVFFLSNLKILFLGKLRLKIIYKMSLVFVENLKQNTTYVHYLKK